MSTKINQLLKRTALAFFGIIIATALLGLTLFPRPEFPALVTDDYCNRNNIHLDGTSIETIYLTPDSILANPEAFLQKDPAYIMFREVRAKFNDPFPFQKWENKLQALSSKPIKERKKETPYKLYALIMENQGSFCKEVRNYVMAYLPEGTNLNVTISLTSLERLAPAAASDGQIVFSLSHPLFTGATLLHDPTGLSAFYNLALHELFHIGFSQHFEPPSLEEHKANEIPLDMLMVLQNEGMATYVSHELNPVYPTPFEWFIYLVDQETIVRWYINEMNDLFAIGREKLTSKAYQDVYRDITSLGYHRKGFYIVGAYMAQTIENELGREVLVQTISDGYESFAETYNAVTDENMKIRWRPEP